MALVELLNLFGNYDGFSVLLRVIEEVKISPAELAIGLHFLEKVLVFFKKQFIRKIKCFRLKRLRKQGQQIVEHRSKISYFSNQDTFTRSQSAL